MKSDTIRNLEDSELDQVSGGRFAQTAPDIDVDKTLAATAAVMFGAGAVVYGAAALTALWAPGK